MRIIAAVALFAALIVSHPSWAQSSPAADTSTVKLQLARQIIATSGGREQGERMIKIIFSSTSAILHDVPPDQRRITTLMQSDIQDAMIALVPKILEISTQAYADHLSEQELRTLLEWQQSPIAASIRSKTPGMLQEVVNREMPLISAAMPSIMQKALDRVCVETKCTAEDRQVITAALSKTIQRPHS